MATSNQSEQYWCGVVWNTTGVNICPHYKMVTLRNICFSGESVCLSLCCCGQTNPLVTEMYTVWDTVSTISNKHYLYTNDPEARILQKGEPPVDKWESRMFVWGSKMTSSCLTWCWPWATIFARGPLGNPKATKAMTSCVLLSDDCLLVCLVIRKSTCNMSRTD